MPHVFEGVYSGDVVGVCPDCESEVDWDEVSDLAEQGSVLSWGWGSKKFNCDSCHLPLIAVVVSKPFKSLTITKAG